ncbi:MAG: hypothetical protein OER88_14880 [Planctomycetota bacterium]|nr:hypothetical protein [Planctomycetota bacterium]
MRRVVALACGAAYLAFGLVAGAAHVHEGDDFRDEVHGLHLDHTHLGGGLDHDGEHHGEGRAEPCQVDHHHDGGALYLKFSARRAFDPGLHPGSAIVVVGTSVEAPSLVSWNRNEPPRAVRPPPKSGPTPPRAPPV